MKLALTKLFEGYVGTGRLKGKVALVTGGDSGIGRAVAIAFAKEGADVAIAFLDECDDARETQRAIEETGSRALSLKADLADEGACREVVNSVVSKLGALDVLVNNIAEQHPQKVSRTLLRSSSNAPSARTSSRCSIACVQRWPTCRPEAGSLTRRP